MYVPTFRFSFPSPPIFRVQEENLEEIGTTIQDPQFGILTVDAFDDQQEPIIPAHQEYSIKLWIRIKRR